MTRLDRLREIVEACRRPATSAAVAAPSHGLDSGRPVCDVVDALGAVPSDDDVSGATSSSVVANRIYDADHRYGRRSVGEYPRPTAQALDWLSGLRASPDAGGHCEGATSSLYFDLETTGLSGGAGTVPFIVGFGWFDGCRFETRQYFLRHLGHERRMLKAIADAVERAGALVTFNGRSFDVPIMDARFAFHRLDSPFAGMPHVDLLHPGRHLWRSDETRLVTLERAVLGVHREGDVAGSEIPARYVGYLRTGDARPLEPVMEHNRLDLVSLGLLTGIACQLVRTGATGTQAPSQAFGLGRVYEKVGQRDLAAECYRRAAGFGTLARAGRRGSTAGAADAEIVAEALRRLAGLYRRQRRYGDAAEAWGSLLSLPRVCDRLRHEATVALAVHHEHRLRDLRAALAHARAALEVVPTPERRRAVERRLGRLGRKLAASDDGALLEG